MAKRKTKKKISAKAGAAMHRAGGAGIAAYHRGRAVAKGFAKRKPTSKPKKKKKKKAAKKRRSKKGGKKKGSYTTKMQIGRSKVRAKCPEDTTLIGAVVASKDRKGVKHTAGVARCVKGRYVR